MMRRLSVLYMPHPLDVVNDDWGDDIQSALCADHDVRVFDRTQAAEPQFQNIEVIVDLGGNIRAEWVDLAADVKYIQAQTNGLDHVEVDRILGAGMLLAHCPGDLSSSSLAEGAMMFILMLAHRYGEGRRNFHTGIMNTPMGMEIEGRTLLIVGFGASGQELARRAKPFGMRIHAVDIRPIKQEILDEIQPDFVGSPEDLDRLIADCDFVSVHLHLTDATRHTIDARRIGLMKPTAYVINVSRGELVDEAALYEAIQEKRIGGAGFDAFAEEPPEVTLPVYKLPNMYVQPHRASGPCLLERISPAMHAERKLRRVSAETGWRGFTDVPTDCRNVPGSARRQSRRNDTTFR